MKKRIVILGLLILILLTYFIFFKKDNKQNKKLRIAEVTHSIFYTPQYVALSEGYFKDEGLDVELILTPGADKVTASVLSGDVEIGFCGPEATIYVYQSGEKDYLKTFAQLTKKDGSFIVSRNKIDNFKPSDLVGKTIVGGRKGGMPEMTLEWALRENDVIPNKDVTIDTSVAFAAMQGAFIGGTGDFVTLFEPNATDVEKNGYGYVVASVGELGGSAPYTAYNARKSFIDNNPDTIKGFNKAINKALKFVRDNDSTTIAKSIHSHFIDMSVEDLAKSIERYKKQDTWNETTKLTKESFDHLQDIMIMAKELKKKVSFYDLVDNTYN
ncbi:MAG: ABC transporter substrate-binding protein [Bacilli bacterium]|nr:ABC transporter substrate-binding protein [Bacilli bacterium]